MADETGRFVIIFNGEIYNYREIRKSLSDRGHTFRSDSDTEVLLKLYIEQGAACLEQLNGFFAFAIYDNKEQEMFLARDRMGIKPLLYSIDDDRFIFGSEMKAMMAYGLRQDINYEALLTYLQLNYIPHPQTIFKEVHKCPPGHYMLVKNGQMSMDAYYTVSRSESKGYAFSKARLVELLDQAVQKRLVADVPIGAFLSGGIDSSCIVGLASRHVDQLDTFSIGFRDNRFFDETTYANEVARHFGTQHHVFSLTNYDLLNHLDEVTDYMDEPFADSSALPVYILSKETRNKATVALSGDGADELFGGYNKHAALSRSLSTDISGSIVTGLLPLWKALPKSRSSKFENRIRQFERFAQGNRLNHSERYWRWATFNSKYDALQYLSPQSVAAIDQEAYDGHRRQYLKGISSNPDLNDFLLVDTKLILPNDMLTKVDLMSMANGLEVRVPFLDHNVVDFAFGLKPDFKLKGKQRKRILKDAFKEILPASLYTREKKGFEVPLLSWFRNELSGQLDKELFNQEIIDSQGIFNWESISSLKKQLHSGNPSDAHAKVWSLFVFQRWWKKNIRIDQMA